MLDGNSLDGSEVYRRQADIVAREVAGEMILVPIKGHLANLQRIFTLNPVGEFLWSQLDGRSTVREITRRLVREFEVTAEQAEADTLQFISELEVAGLVERVRR